MSRLALVAVLVLASVATARMPYQLPADVEQYLSSPIQTTFSCDNLPYGYYADVDNNCELFHVCFPVADEIGALVETAHFTFACGNETVFDQESLVCSHKDLSFPCSEARTLYELSNSEFFRIPEDI
ncbi:U-scoloptoxin(01)-Cw1a-like [Cherax quadricarinatus]|uniref:U-scoloptoxin(01)-Cw1a-like n=1 Tax=Cherax quadricarinatus TaxID=27406 RepID=UPI0023780C50|nr:U-scoloptoxin(01)-Cw1a-like [Cherax quadricarinatus]XP_053633582.1 U-scoloptoxin(01)-Cw1a-like [Cherax quadricarinatus]